MAIQQLENTCLACKKSSDIFNVLNEKELEKIDCQKVSIKYKPGEIIFKQGAPANFFVCVTSGLVKLYIEHQNSRNLIIGLTRPINYIFEPGPFVDLHHHVTAVACEETTTCLIDVKVMKELIVSNPAFANEFIKKISIQAVRLFDRISSCTQKHVYGRVADTLLYLHPGIYVENPFELSVSRQDLADLSGMTKESIIRVLKKFKEDDIIVLEGNHIKVNDREKLEVISKKG
jgi:CRP/FNR family transcriptional regulator, polysaccharide utilization system transcription regulator